MADAQLQKIQEQLVDHENRIRALEVGKVKTDNHAIIPSHTQKEITLAEIIRGKNFKSGQEKVAVIIGYCEKMLKTESIKESNVKESWKIGKFDGKYSPSLLAQAIKDRLVRNIDGNLDLSQTGEKFWDSFTK